MTAMPKWADAVLVPMISLIIAFAISEFDPGGWLDFRRALLLMLPSAG